MKHSTLFNKRMFSTSILITCLSISILAQDQGYFTITLDMLTDVSSPSLPSNNETPTSKELERFFTESAENDVLTPKGSDLPMEIPSYFRQHKELPDNFSGYVIELLQSDKKLARDYPLFERFGNIHVTQLENKMYSYCIIANFNKANKVKIFAEEIIAPQVPQAQALKYKKGHRKKM